MNKNTPAVKVKSEPLGDNKHSLDDLIENESD